MKDNERLLLPRERNEKKEVEKDGEEGGKCWMLIAEQPPFSTVVQLARVRFPCADERLVINGKKDTNQNSALLLITYVTQA